MCEIMILAKHSDVGLGVSLFITLVALFAFSMLPRVIGTLRRHPQVHAIGQLCWAVFVFLLVISTALMFAGSDFPILRDLNGFNGRLFGGALFGLGLLVWLFGLFWSLLPRG